MGLVAELQGVAADRAALDVLQVVGGLVVELAVHCDQPVVAKEFGDELGGVLLGGYDIYAVLGACESDVEEAALFGVIDAVVAFFFTFSITFFGGNSKIWDSVGGSLTPKKTLFCPILGIKKAWGLPQAPL